MLVAELKSDAKYSGYGPFLAVSRKSLLRNLPDRYLTKAATVSAAGHDDQADAGTT